MSQCGIALNRTNSKYNVVGYTYVNIGLKCFKDQAEYLQSLGNYMHARLW